MTYRLARAAVVIFLFAAFAQLPVSAGGKKDAKREPIAKYRAELKDKKLTVFAEGTNNSGGWKNELTVLPIEIYPPQFKFTQTRPDGIAIQVISPFSVHKTVDAGTRIESVTVSDSAGKHKVMVKAIP